MRLIDVDKADVERIDCFYGGECRLEDVQEWLNEQPTVNPYKWISVEDRLPEENTDVLIYRGGFRDDLMNVYTYMGHNEWEDEYGYWSRTDDEGITHWMPLPEPPKD